MTKTKVLIVEDEIIIAKALSMILKDKGYDICTLVCTGEDAIKITEEEKPDILLLDISLPGGMDGIAAGKIIEEYYNTPIIYTSGIAREELMEKLGNPQQFDFLTKPLSKDDVLKSIELRLHG